MRIGGSKLQNKISSIAPPPPPDTILFRLRFFNLVIFVQICLNFVKKNQITVDQNNQNFSHIVTPDTNG